MPRNSKTNQQKKDINTHDQSNSQPEFDLASIAESSTDSFLLFDENLNCVGINPAGQVLFNVSEAEVVGKNIDDIIPAVKDDPIERDKYVSVIKTSDLLVTNTTLGELCLGIKAFKVGDGLGIAASDITERKKTEEAVHTEKEWWQCIFHALDDIVIVLDKDRRVEAVNDSGCEFLDKTRDDILGKPCHQVLYRSKKPVEDCPLEAVIEDRQHRAVEVEQFGRHYTIVLSPILNDKGEVQGLVEVMKDITEHKQVENELEEKCSQLVAKLERLSFEEKTAEDLKQRCAELEKMLEEAEAEVQHLEEVKETNIRLAAMLEKTEGEKQDADKLREYCNTLESKIKVMKTELKGFEDLRIHYTDLETRLMELEAEAETAAKLQEHCSDLETRLAEERNKTGNAEEVVERCTVLESKVQELEAELAAAQEFKERSSLLQTQLEEVESSVHDAEAVREHCIELEGKLAEMETEKEISEELRKRCAELETRLEEQTNNLERSDDLEQRYAELEVKMVELEAAARKSQELEQHCRELEEQLAEREDTKQPQKLEQQYAELEAKLAEITSEIMALKQNKQSAPEEPEDVGGAIEESLRDLFNSIDDAVFLIDTNYMIEDVNKSGVDLLEKEKEDVVGSNYCEVIYGEAEPRETLPLKAAAETRDVQSETVDIYGKRFIMRACPSLNEEGELGRISVILRDITHIEVIEDKLQDYEKKFIELSTQIEHWKQKLEALLGVEE